METIGIIFFVTIISVTLATLPESVILRGAIGSSEDCGTTSCGFCDVYKITPCVSRANQTCPLQTLYANREIPTYTKEIFYGPTVTFDFFHMRWATWLITDSKVNTAVLALMKQTRNDKDAEWCNGIGILYKGCFWRNYTLTACNSLNKKRHRVLDLQPIASVHVVIDPLNTFGTIATFDVFYQTNCTLSCETYGLACCSDFRDHEDHNL